MSLSDISGNNNNAKIEQAFNTDLLNKYKSVERKASETIGTFATLVDELMKLKELSKGTKAKEEITKLTGELNNSSVFFARMITDELSKIHNIVSPEVTSEKV